MARTVIDMDEHYPEHPLFPVEEGDNPPDISFVHITRWERGKQIWGKCLPSHELQTIEQLQELYGGGEYVLVGRTQSKITPGIPARISKQRKLTVPGKSKPMSDDPTEEEENGGKKVVSPQPTGLLGGGSDQIFIAMMQMNQQAQERAAAAQQQFMTMFIQMMQSSKTESAAMTQMMMQMSQAQAQSMMQMVTGLMANRGGGPEEMAKYAELLKTLGFSKEGASKEEEKSGFGMEDLPAMIENVADIATAAAELRRGPSQPSNGMPQTPQIASGEGSAASIAQAMNLGKS